MPYVIRRGVFAPCLKSLVFNHGYYNKGAGVLKPREAYTYVRAGLREEYSENWGLAILIF